MFWSIAIITQIGQKELHTIYFLVGRLSVGLTAMKPNGPAIWGGCVTRRSIRAGSWYPEYSGVQFVSKTKICQDAGFLLRADVRVRVQRPLQICLDGRSKSKKCDKQLNHIVRVSTRFCLKFRL